MMPPKNGTTAIDQRRDFFIRENHLDRSRVFQTEVLRKQTPMIERVSASTRERLRRNAETKDEWVRIRLCTYARTGEIT